MMYLNAFLLGGAFCLLTQLLFRVTKLSVVTILTSTFCRRVSPNVYIDCSLNNPLPDSK